jgi:hypothetical protein
MEEILILGNEDVCFWKNWIPNFDQWGCVFFEKIFIEIRIWSNEDVYFLKKCFIEIRILSIEAVYFLKKCVSEVVGFSILMINILSHFRKNLSTTYPYPAVPTMTVSPRTKFLVLCVPCRIRPWTIRFWTTCPDLDYCRRTDRSHYAVPQCTYAPQSTLVSVSSFQLGPPIPFPQTRMSPWNQRGGGYTRLRVRGGGPIQTTGEKA